MENKQTKFSRGTLTQAAQILGLPPSTAKYRYLTGDAEAIKIFEAVEKIKKESAANTEAQLKKLIH